jgi:Flp pilus assembly pilin Flp
MSDITPETERTLESQDENTATEAANLTATVPCDKERKEKDASMVEYALVVGLIAVLCIIAIRVLGQQISRQFSNVAVQVS